MDMWKTFTIEGRKVDQSMCYIKGKPDSKLFMLHPEAWCHEGELPVKNRKLRKKKDTMPIIGFMKPNDFNIYDYDSKGVTHTYSSYDDVIAAGWIVD
jgi:hypothetical protein